MRIEQTLTYKGALLFAATIAVAHTAHSAVCFGIGFAVNRTDPTQEGWEAAWNEYYDKYGRQFGEDIRSLERAIHTEMNREVEVGDGVTMYLYSDAYACTVIAKTAKTITS